MVDRPPRRGLTARHLQLGLAVLWLLDGALQLQPFMFTQGFARQVIAPAAQGQPALVSAAVGWAARLVAAHPVAWDAGFAAVQILIGLGLIWSRTARLALLGSFAWAAGIWYLGEGLGGIGGAHTSLLVGAPGAVAVYAVIGAAAWPDPAKPPARSPAAVTAWLLSGGHNRPPRSWAPAAWALIWVGDAVFRLLPGQNRAGDLASTIAGNAGSAPAWLASLDRAVASGMRHGGTSLVAAFFAVEVAIGLLALASPPVRAVAAGAGIALAAFFWLVGQSLGGIYSGQATDPSTAIPLALLGAALLYLPGRRAAVPAPAAAAATAAASRRRAHRQPVRGYFEVAQDRL